MLQHTATCHIKCKLCTFTVLQKGITVGQPAIHWPEGHNEAAGVIEFLAVLTEIQT